MGYDDGENRAPGDPGRPPTRRSHPRRSTVATLLASTLTLALTAVSPAVAGSPTVRSDPNDRRSRPDIRKVWTDVSRRGVSLQVGTWDAIRNDEFGIILDTRASPNPDRLVEMNVFGCTVQKLNRDRSLGAFIGQRDARRPGRRTISCRVPTGWFGIRTTVRFLVKSESELAGVRHDDRAPDNRRYVGF